jgi:hypothetical protein
MANNFDPTLDLATHLQNYGGYTAPPALGGWGGGLMPQAGSTGTMGIPAKVPTFWDKMIGWTDPATQVQHAGWGGLALGGIEALGSGWLGLQQYGLAKDQLKFQKEAFNRDFANQVKMINGQLEDRQRARVQSNPYAYESVGAYLDKNRVG